MNNLFIKTLTIFLIIGLSGCAYKPIFSEQNYGFEIESIVFNGENNINSIINNKLKFIKNDGDNNKKYTLEITSKKIRNIVSNDTKGDPLKFEMVILVECKIFNNGNLLQNNKIEKNNVYNNDSDQFKLEQTEDIIVKNLAESASDILISSIINLNDN